MTEEYDLIVMGSGGGLKLALPAAMQGERVALLEMGPLGGTCLNRGCIPSKMLIYPADFLEEAGRCISFNVTLGGQPHVDFKGLIQRIERSTTEISQGIVQRLDAQENLELIRERGVFTGPKTLRAGSRTLRAERILIACGSVPSVPPIPGLADVPYITSTEALRLPEQPRRMIVIGAGYIACELGHAYSMFGTETHFLVRSRLLRREDDEVQQLFEREFSRHNHIHQGVTPMKVEYRNGLFGVTVADLHGRHEVLEGDSLLVATGVKPATDKLGLDKTGVRCTAEGFIPVDDYLQTEVEGIYAIGDVIGRYLFRHSVNLEGDYLFGQLYGNQLQRRIEYGPMPRAVFTVPEIASAGKTEQELRAEQVDYVCGRALYCDSNMGMARQTHEGFAKLLIGRADRRLLGVHIIGPDAATLVQTVVALMYRDGTLDDLLGCVYIHPAQPELIRDAARDARQFL
jgi:dihydrolipoamide dehydrogenase